MLDVSKLLEVTVIDMLNDTYVTTLFSLSPTSYNEAYLHSVRVSRPPRPSGSLVSSSFSFGMSDGVLRERDRSPRAPIPAPVLVLAPPPPRMPMMDARRYRRLFGQRRVAPPPPPPNDNESSEEDPDEHEDPHSSSDTSHSSRDVFLVDAS
ncbi:hypothetical protein PIB30_044542 [Stylosanthes scabra]|uniref:Uncharacterized protein n=1 Tax=Stylosanthes scabra TaxID=79078 RepID=A0ABU6TFK2_9FABA|nr:hypothetical protein [Stylosanthes scabra]